MFIEVTSATLRAHPKQALSTARQQGRGGLERLYTTRYISVVQLKPTKKYLQRLLVPLAFATAKSALYSVPSAPKMLAAVANRWADTEWKVPSSSAMVKGKRRRGLPSTRACSSWKWNRGAAAPEYRRLRAFPIWGIHGQTQSTFICGINGVGGRGGGGGAKTLFPFSQYAQVKFFRKLVQYWVLWSKLGFYGNHGYGFKVVHSFQIFD